MKKTPLLLLLTLFIILNESCHKNDHSNYNPYNITEPEIETELTEEEKDIRFAEQMVNTSSILPELIHITMQSAVEALLLDSLGTSNPTADVRTGCPCIDYVPNSTTGGGILTLTFDDGSGSCSTPGVGLLDKTYSGSIIIDFLSEPNLFGNTFTMELIDFSIENYNILIFDGQKWEFTWDIFQDFFFGGFQAPLWVINTNNGDLTIYEPNPNDPGDEMILATFSGPTTSDPEEMAERAYEFVTFDFTDGCCGPETPDFLKVTCTQIFSMNPTTKEFLLSAGDLDGSGDIDPLVVDPMECGCYLDGSIWIQPFDQSTPLMEHNFGYTIFGSSSSGVCDATYLRRAYSGDPNGALMTSAACEL